MIHNILQYGFLGLTVLLALGAFARGEHKQRFGIPGLLAAAGLGVMRYSVGFGGFLLVLAALTLMVASPGTLMATAACTGLAAISAHFDVFWLTALFALTAVWLGFTNFKYIDLSWRAKTGFVIFLTLGSALILYPTYHDERWGRPDESRMTPEERVEVDAKARRGDLGWSRYFTSNIPFRLVRGLDLKGGLRLVYSVDVDEAIKDKRDRYYDELRAALTTAMGLHTGDKPPTLEELAKLPTKARVEKSRENVGVITVKFVDPADSKKVDDAFLKRFLGELQIQRAADGSQIIFRMKGDVESEIRSKAVSQAKDTVQRRVDGLGLKEVHPVVRGEDIIIEIPGDDDKQFAEIRDIISQTARLEFKMVDDDTDFFAQIARSSKPEDLPRGLEFQVENAPLGVGKTAARYFAYLKKSEREDMREAQRRLKEWITTLQVDPDHEIGLHKVEGYNEEKDTVEEIGWRTYYLFSKAEITGDMVREAHARHDASDRGVGGWLVQMELNSVGADRFEDITGRNVKKRFAIVLDGRVESAPVINSKIPGGHAVITMGSGNQDQQLADSKKLELVLRSGALPAPISPSNEQRIGPSLGKDAIAQGMKGAIAGALLVFVFMIGYYSRAGMIAIIAVVFNLVLQVAILAMFGAAMSLPGIAGLTLTIGIAVDANVLINERIREELHNGKSARAAVDVGYDKAFSAILDGHVTTLISGLILAQFGTGPIKGFAWALIVGIAVSLFTGVVCTRLMFDWAVRGRSVKKLYLGQVAPANKSA